MGKISGVKMLLAPFTIILVRDCFSMHILLQDEVVLHTQMTIFLLVATGFRFL
jgi:hypothetical protein